MKDFEAAALLLCKLKGVDPDAGRSRIFVLSNKEVAVKKLEEFDHLMQAYKLTQDSK